MTIPKRLSMLAAAFACCGLLAACGSSGTKISSAAFLTKCQSELNGNSTIKQAHLNTSSVCQCVQQKLVAQGDGSKTTDDNSLKGAAETAGRQCGEQAAAAAVGSSGSSGSSGAASASSSGGTTGSASASSSG